MSLTLLFLLLKATGLTIYMVCLSSLASIAIGLPVGVLLYITRKGSILPQPYVHTLLSLVVNWMRAIPFIIFMIFVVPLTRLLMGTAIGSNAAIVPLSLAAAPFMARIIENAFLETQAGLIEAAVAMGATPLQIIKKVLLPESLSSIINGVTLMIVNLIGYSAMAGTIGGGGLGDFAIHYGYLRFNTPIMLVTIAVIICLVQCIQSGGNVLAHKFAKIKH